MTVTLEIQLTNGTAEFDFLIAPATNSGIRANPNGRVITLNQNGLYEDRIFARGWGTKSLVAASERTLDLIGSRSRQYINDPNFVTDRYWLAETMDGDSAGRRALIYDLIVRIIDGPGDQSRMMNLNITHYEIIIMRGEFESMAQRTAITQSNMASGDKKLIAAGGTLPGRPYRVLLEPGASIGTGATATTRHWFGIRPTYHGTTGFVGEWDWASGTFGDDTSESGGTVTISFATTPGKKVRVTLKLSDIVGSNYDDFIGEYLLVMSMIIGGDANTRVGFRVVGDGVESEWIYSDYTNSANQIFEVGTIRIPSQAVRDVSIDLSDVEIRFGAELIESTGSIQITKVYAVPLRHFCYLEGSLDSADSSGYVALYMHPEDEPLQVNSDGSIDTLTADNRAIVNWQVPVAGGIFVYVGASDDGVIRDGVDLTLDIFDRWAGNRV